MISIVVLGAAAGGGFPQWNSNAERCRRARALDPACPPQSQAALAVSGNGVDWFLLNASPDLRQQILATPALHPAEGLRSSPIRGVILTSGEVDAIAGLLCLRERHHFSLFATTQVLDVLRANPIFDALHPEFVSRHACAPSLPFALGNGAGALQATLFPVPGKVPLFLENVRAQLNSDDDVSGVEISDGRKRMVFIPGCAHIDDVVRARVSGADVVLFDGTLWEDNEMIVAGLGPKTGRRMGHMPVQGPGGTLEAFETLPVGRKILIHLNNSNPILDRGSSEQAAVRAAGWDVAFDGMEITL
ncbi:MAG TPA: pyrroloquinoline quinone biosynthesis protein PqqB [Acidisoma sp.]|uniref:pyrroloquinoline quinone biosynthesis protein PqqB n=1 Tax=Acidisoma sp. TaxID=1872115 RepID=UPI002CB8283B|nr:pyrroloquinoline quinone biosynthesis protein PqqB [Acidisoma sp.]HTI01304.1 pyrroloquinoline quinone biosynthesis protein PqqB [Acidisoma sp.]